MSGIDEVEFKKIFNNWYKPIRNYLYYKTGDAEVAEDITQDTFLKVWEKRNNVKTETIKALLYTIANNLFLNRVERQKVSFRFEQNHRPGNMVESPHYELEMKEFDQKLQNALADLDDKKREVFLMNRIDGFTYREIAENLEITVKAVEKRMEKAIAFLKQKIEYSI
jgi:RNA polymerase sigma-70 factor (ECF subfamily)